MTTLRTHSHHPALVRTTVAFAAVGARQGSNALPTLAQGLMALGLSVATIAALVLG